MSEHHVNLRQALEAAIADYAREVDSDPDSNFEVLTDFVVVAAWSTIDGDNATYSLLTPDRNHPAHRTVGLLQVALTLGVEHDH